MKKDGIFNIMNNQSNEIKNLNINIVKKILEK
jgi:hypothetical protein